MIYMSQFDLISMVLSRLIFLIKNSNEFAYDLDSKLLTEKF